MVNKSELITIGLGVYAKYAYTTKVQGALYMPKEAADTLLAEFGDDLKIWVLA